MKATQVPYRESDPTETLIADRQRARDRVVALERELETSRAKCLALTIERDDALRVDAKEKREAVEIIAAIVAVILLIMAVVGLAYEVIVGCPVGAAGSLAAVVAILVLLRRILGKTWRW